VKVKICGITSVDVALASCEAGADALGFNFVSEARTRGRYVSPEVAREIIAQLPPFAMKVAVMADPTPDEIAEVLTFVDYVQLHGNEPPGLYSPFASRVIKVFRVAADFDAQTVLQYPAAAYLVDARVPGSLGGTGAVCDWDAARRIVSLGKWVILAGGLTCENVAEAVRAVRPYAVDVASGVESAPGQKDLEKIKRFIQIAKTAYETV